MQTRHDDPSFRSHVASSPHHLWGRAAYIVLGCIQPGAVFHVDVGGKPKSIVPPTSFCESCFIIHMLVGLLCNLQVTRFLRTTSGLNLQLMAIVCNKEKISELRVSLRVVGNFSHRVRFIVPVRDPPNRVEVSLDYIPRLVRCLHWSKSCCF